MQVHIIFQISYEGMHIPENKSFSMEIKKFNGLILQMALKHWF